MSCRRAGSHANMAYALNDEADWIPTSAHATGERNTRPVTAAGASSTWSAAAAAARSRRVSRRWFTSSAIHGTSATTAIAAQAPIATRHPALSARGAATSDGTPVLIDSITVVRR